ncbi:MAG: CBS domain-containing protein [Armatimonadia bacterium]
MDLLARDIMTETVTACVPDTRLEDVVKTLAESGISGMPVIDANQKVVGIISESDLLLADEKEAPRMKTALFGFYILRESVMDRMAELRGVLAKDIMTKHVISFHPETPVHEIATTLAERKINRVPIVDDAGKLVGIVSRADIIKAMVTAM